MLYTIFIKKLLFVNHAVINITRQLRRWGKTFWNDHIIDLFKENTSSQPKQQKMFFNITVQLYMAYNTRLVFRSSKMTVDNHWMWNCFFHLLVTGSSDMEDEIQEIQTKYREFRRNRGFLKYWACIISRGYYLGRINQFCDIGLNWLNGCWCFLIGDSRRLFD